MEQSRISLLAYNVAFKYSAYHNKNHFDWFYVIEFYG